MIATYIAYGLMTALFIWGAVMFIRDERKRNEDEKV